MKLSGSLDVRVDSSGLKAYLLFTPKAAENVWTREGVMKLLFSKGIIEGFDAAKIDSALSVLASGKTRETVIAEGVDPIPATEEDLSWENLSVPESSKEKIKDLVSHAKPPVITVKSSEPVKEEQKEKKFSLFGGKAVAGKEPAEKESVVRIDPKIISYGYVAEGGKIGTVLPGNPGKPGKSILGSVIPAEVRKDPAVYLGGGIERRKGELVALKSGIVRRGVNWADLIPFKALLWSVSLSPDKSTALLDFTPGTSDIPLPGGDKIRDKAIELGVPGELLFSSEKIEALISEASAQGKTLLQEPLSEQKDGGFSLDVSEDKLKAVLTIRKGTGKGKPLVLKDVGNAIKTSGLKKLDQEKIKQDILEFYRGPEIVLSEYLLAEGTPPTAGTERVFTLEAVFLAKKDKEQLLSRISDAQPEAFNGIESINEFPITEDVEFSFVKADQLIGTLGPVVKGEPGTDVFGRILEGLPGKDPGLVLYENIKQEKESIIAKTDGLLEMLKKEDSVLLRVRPHRDGTVEIKLSQDRMTATMSLFAEQGTGKPLTRDSLDKAIADKGIVKGINAEALSNGILKAKEEGFARDLILAMGKAPRDVRDNKVEFSIKLATGKSVTIDKTGRADYRHQDRITSVKEGAIVAEIRAPNISPEDGWDVTGKELSAKSVQALSLEIGPNIKKDVDDAGDIFLIAEKSGELVYENNKIEIRDVHTIQGNVDLKCGNIKFSGTVNVSGSVLPGFYIMAGGDININENADSALLSADGSIRVNQGIKGGGKGVARVKQDLWTGFIEQATLLVVGDIHVKNSCLRCAVKCNGKLLLESEKGNLVGGQIKARKGINALNIGTEKGVKTEISFGQDYLISDQIEIEEREIHKLKEALSKIDFTMKKLEQQGFREPLENARAEKLKYLKIMEKRTLRLFTLREKFEEHFPSEVVVRGTLFPGVVFESHGRFLEITEKKKGVVIFFDQTVGHIREREIEGKSSGSSVKK